MDSARAKEKNMNNLSSIISRLLKFGDAALFSDTEISSAANELAELEFELQVYRKENNMMISLRPRAGGGAFYLNVGLIEAIIEREGNTSEIRLTNGKIYTSIESPEQLANRVTRAQMSSELAKPKEGIYANSLR